MDQLHRVAADELCEVVSQQPRRGRAAVQDRAVRPEQFDGVPTLFHERTKASLADPQRRFGGLLCGLTTRCVSQLTWARRSSRIASSASSARSSTTNTRRDSVATLIAAGG